MISLMLNIAAGALIQVIPALQNDPSLMGGASYFKNDTTFFTNEMEKVVNPTSEAEDSYDASTNLIDLNTIGFISRLARTAKQYMYGIINLFKNTIGTYLDKGVYEYLFTGAAVLYKLMTLVYIIGLWSLWTERRIDVD